MDPAIPPQSLQPIGFEMQDETSNVPPNVPLGFEGVMGPGDSRPVTPDNLYPDPADSRNSSYLSVAQPRQDATDEDGLTEIKVAPRRMTVQEESVDKRSTTFFNDGKRKIDYILAYKDPDKEDEKEQKHLLRRQTFETNLEKEGLEMETEDKKFSQDGKTYFVKIHAPWEVLTRMAELMSIKMPIKEYETMFEEGCLKCPTPFDLPTELVPDEADFFTADFNRERENMFIIDDKNTFFSSAQRSLMVHQLLMRIRYDEDERDKIGIDRLLRHGIYTGAFPLHDGKYHSEHSILTEGADNDRHLLYESWARPGRWYFFQPLDNIRRYFGEKIAIYFCWLGFYTAMLIPASLVGLVVFFYGVGTLFQNSPSEEICDVSGVGNITMCPLCDKRCSYWFLTRSCTYSRLTYLFDNYATVFFAGFMSIWATCFLEFWKRKQAEIQYDWDVAGYELEEHVRPEFEAKCNKKKLNPVTMLQEPFLPLYSRIPRKVTSVFVIIFMIFCVLAAVFGVIMYRIIVVAVLYAAENDLVRSQAKLTTTATAALLNLMLIMVLNKLYERVALWLTELERPRTDSDYEDSFTFKMFLFQFINYYTSIFYIAFFKGRLGGRPGKYDYSLGYRAEECDPAGCLIELCIQLAIVFVGKQVFNNFKEIMLPKILNWFRTRNTTDSSDNLYTRWEQDSDLQNQPALGLFEEYLEMVIQFGFVTIFVAAFPLAPLFALINNVVEIRLDAYKFVTQWKRPIAQRAQDIGIWFGILKGVTFIAVLTNAFIIGWTSEFVPKMVYKFTVSGDGSLAGYVNNSLSYFDTWDFQPESVPDDNKTDVFGHVRICRYKDYRRSPWEEDKYKYTAEYWHVFMGRLAFVIVFEHTVFFLTWLVTYLIPDVPGRVKQLMLREMYLAKEARYNATFMGVQEDKEARKRHESTYLMDVIDEVADLNPPGDAEPKKSN